MKDVFGGGNVQYIQHNQSFPQHWYMSSLRISGSVTGLAACAHTVCARTQNFSYDFISPRQNVKNWSAWFPAVQIDSTFSISSKKCT